MFSAETGKQINDGDAVNICRFGSADIFLYKKTKKGEHIQMKKTMKKAVTLFMALTLCTGTAVYAAANEENQDTRTVTDVTGRTFEVPEKVERVVALSAADCEVVYALGAGDLLVGRGEYCNYPEEAAEVPSVQSGSETNIEQIIALDPQVVIMSKMDQTEEQVAALENAGIAVCMNDETDIEGVYGSIRMIGEVLGKDEKAEEIVTDMQDTFTTLSEAAKDKTGGSIYFEVSPLEYGLWTTGKNTFMNELAEMIGLTNIFEDVEGWAEVSEEQVIERNPDYIVTITMYFGEGPAPEDEIKGRAGWQDITAVKNDKVYNANSDQISRPGPRLADAASMLYDFVYGES